MMVITHKIKPSGMARYSFRKPPFFHVFLRRHNQSSFQADSLSTKFGRKVKTPMIDWKISTLIHIGYLQNGRERQYLFLRKTDAGQYVWEYAKTENNTPAPVVIADSAEEALRLAYSHWRVWHSLPCGFRFTLPERDEVGTPALFHQMVRSYRTGNGVYLDEELGGSCIVHDAPSHTLALWRSLEKGGSIS